MSRFHRDIDLSRGLVVYAMDVDGYGTGEVVGSVRGCGVPIRGMVMGCWYGVIFGHVLFGSPFFVNQAPEVFGAELEN